MLARGLCEHVVADDFGELATGLLQLAHRVVEVLRALGVEHGEDRSLLLVEAPMETRRAVLAWALAVTAAVVARAHRLAVARRAGRQVGGLGDRSLRQGKEGEEQEQQRSEPCGLDVRRSPEPPPPAKVAALTITSASRHSWSARISVREQTGHERGGSTCRCFTRCRRTGGVVRGSPGRAECGPRGPLGGEGSVPRIRSSIHAATP